MINLPKVKENVCLDFEWFPTKAQCFIYRNWGLVTPEKMAQVLETETATVLSMAEDMGLDLSEEVLPEWRTRGYITLLRNCWHLLDYEQLALLLDWDMDYLACLSVHESDFPEYGLHENTTRMTLVYTKTENGGEAEKTFTLTLGDTDKYGYYYARPEGTTLTMLLGGSVFHKAMTYDDDRIAAGDTAETDTDAP